MDITTIKYPSHNDLVQWYYQLAQRIADTTGVTPEQVNELIDAYIAGHPYPVVPDDIITQANADANVVTSVNGEKGDVTVKSGGDVPENVITTDNIGQNAVTSFNGEKGVVNYTAPVTSVNGQTGAVTVTESPKNVITSDNIAEHAVTSFNGQVGAIDYPYTPVYPGLNGFTIPVSAGRALVFVDRPATFAGIDITYNIKFDKSLFTQILRVYSCLPVKTSGADFMVKSVSVSGELNLKIWVEDDGGISGPPYSECNFRVIMLVITGDEAV